jgi:hypothetical protein
MPLSLRTGRAVGVRVCDGQGDLSRWQRADGQLRPSLEKPHLLRRRLAG